MRRAELNLLNSQWHYPGGGDYAGLFRQLDVTREAQKRAAMVPGWQKGAAKTLKGKMPKIATGPQCTDLISVRLLSSARSATLPGPAHPIDLLPDAAGKKLARKLWETKGYTSILEPKPAEFVGAEAKLYRRIQRAHRTGKAVLAPGADKVMDGFRFPRYFFDFEGIDLPVPHWVGVRPYEQIPFQWSCHIEREGGAFEHREFLDLSGEDPSVPCIEALLRAIPPEGDGPIFVYFKTYEKTRMKELAERHPKYSALLENYIGRLVDLSPLVRKYYYHPRMEGYLGIKKVLPVIAPDMDYSALEEVQEGTGEQVAYL